MYSSALTLLLLVLYISFAVKGNATNIRGDGEMDLSGKINVEELRTKEAQDDHVTSLPGLDNFDSLKFQMFSGYVTLPSKIPGDKSRQIFYWFITKEGAKDWRTETTFYWTNGGPGCSGMLGLLTEQGPFRPTKGGEKLLMNKYAWNKLVNIVFVEQPVGVGFSHTGHPEIYNDENAAEDNRQFLIGFLEKFPELKANDLFISSESYGGHYMPTLARNILDHPGTLPNFKGLFVGNPIMWSPLRDIGEFETLAGHQILPAPLVSKWFKAKCDDVSIYRFSLACQTMFFKSSEYKNGLDPYAMDFPVCNDEDALKQMLMLNKNMEKEEDEDTETKQVESEEHEPSVILDSNILMRRRRTQYFPDDYQACEENWAAEFMNRKDVQAALHAVAPKLGSYKTCNDAINIAWSRTSANGNMIPIFDSLMGKGLKLTIFSGDDDTVCPTASLQHWIWKYRNHDSWEQWYVKHQVAGFHASFAKNSILKPDFHIYTVHGAGHMVPSTRPDFAFELLKLYLARD